MARLSRRPRSRSRGLFIAPSRARSAAKPAEARGADRLEFAVVQQSYAAAHHAEDSAGEHDPRLGVGVALGDDRPLCLAPADQIRDEVVHLAHVPAQVALQLGILGRLTQRLHPQLRELELRRPDRDVPLADRLDGGAGIGGLVELPLPVLARLRPDVLERREVQVALRGEVPVQDRLRDAGGAGDLRGGGAVVAAVREEADRRLDQVPAAIGRRHPGRCDAHAASSAMCSCTTWGRVRTVTTATIAAANVITAPTANPAWSPLTYA